LDLRGHGLSEGGEHLQRWRIEDYVADVRAVLDRWETLRILVGHSMGGLVVQLVAAAVRLDRLVLVASSPTEGMRRNGFRMAGRHPWTFAAARLRRSFRRLYRSPRVARALLFHPNTAQAVVDRHLEAVQEESWVAGNQPMTLLPDPRAVACPVIVIAGERDVMVDRRASERTARDYSTPLEVFGACAHMVPCEADPAALARVILHRAR
jgi:pimeloyl-ACP methyl ester carboxylesterase